MSELEQYLKQWSCFNKGRNEADAEYVERLTRLGDDGNLHRTRFRSIYWRFYLGCLSSKRQNWVEETRIYRDLYDKLKAQYLPVTNDPQLLINIKQDVRRTMPDMEYFRDETVQRQITDILTLWSIASPGGKRLSYRQGVHEILAPIFFVMHCDQESLLGFTDCTPVDGTADHPLQRGDCALPEDMRVLLNPEYIEHDTFLMLCRLLYYIEPWYGTNKLYKQMKMQSSPDSPNSACGIDEVPNSTAALLDGRMSRTEAEFQTEHIDIKLARIHEDLLPEIDRELYVHLQYNDIIPQVYGIRWLRLLFGREFPLQDFLIVWDAIFADCLRDHSMGRLTDFIFCSMLMEIRNGLLDGDEQECVGLLMKYPNVEDVTVLVRRAKHLCQNYDKIVAGAARAQRAQNRMNRNNSESVRENLSRTLTAVNGFGRDFSSSVSNWGLNLAKKLPSVKENQRITVNSSSVSGSRFGSQKTFNNQTKFVTVSPTSPSSDSVSSTNTFHGEMAGRELSNSTNRMSGLSLTSGLFSTPASNFQPPPTRLMAPPRTLPLNKNIAAVAAGFQVVSPAHPGFNQVSPSSAYSCGSDPRNAVVVAKLDTVAKQLGDVIQSKSLDADPKAFETLCVALASVKQTRDILSGNISPSSIDEAP